MPYYKVGDEIFQLKDNLMHLDPGTRSGKLPIDQAVFNYRLRKARRVIENSFGILVALWRLFRKPICAEKENITSYILAGVALHNHLQRLIGHVDLWILKSMESFGHENGDE